MKYEIKEYNSPSWSKFINKLIMISQHITMKMSSEVSQCMENEHYIILFIRQIYYVGPCFIYWKLKSGHIVGQYIDILYQNIQIAQLILHISTHDMFSITYPNNE